MDENERFNKGLPMNEDGPSVQAGDPPPPKGGVFAERMMRLAPHEITERPPRRVYLVERDGEDGEHGPRVGWLPLGQVGILASAGGVGKTMALVELALAVATGREWLGMHVPREAQGHVLLALGEESAEEVRRRVYAAFALMWPSEDERHRAEREEALRLIGERVHVVPLSGKPVALVTVDRKTREVHATKAHEDLSALLEAGQDWKLVALDPLSRFAGPDTETDNAAATRFVQAVEELVCAPGKPTVLVSAHTTKASRKGDEPHDATSVRGSSSIVDSARWVATLAPAKRDEIVKLVDPEGTRFPRLAYLECVKSNYGLTDDAKHTLVRGDGGTLRGLTKAERKDLAKARDGRDVMAAKKAAAAEAKRNGKASTLDPSYGDEMNPSDK